MKYIARQAIVYDLVGEKREPLQGLSFFGIQETTVQYSPILPNLEL